MIERWQNLESRERWLVAVGTLVVVVFVGWLTLWRPVNANLAARQAGIANATEQLEWMRAAAAQADRLGGQAAIATPDRGNLSLLALAEQSARASGLTDSLRRGEPVGAGRAQLALESAPLARLLAWLRLLETRYGVAATEVTATGTDQPGFVDARVVLSER